MKHAVPNTNVDKGVCSYDQTQVFKIQRAGHLAV
jgi:hypothetical protein